MLLTLRTFDGRGGLYPSHAALAARAICAVRTVQEALRQGRALGLVSWHSGASRRTSNRYVLSVPRAAAEPGACLSRAAFRLTRKVTAVARALVGKPRQEGEQKINPGRAGLGWNSWPAPHAPLRTVSEQLEILAGFRKEEGLRERKEAKSCYAT